MVLAISGCQESGTTDLLEKIKARGFVRVGYANEAPFAYFDSHREQLTGEAPEIAKTIFKRLQVDKVEGVLTEFSSLIPGLKAGRFDIIAAGMYITPKRCEQVAFSNPTYGIGEALIVKSGNPLGLHSYEDIIRNQEIKLGLVSGTMEIQYARSVGISKEQMVIFPDVPSAFAGVQASRVDGFGATSLTVQDALLKANDETLEQATPFSAPIIQGAQVRGYGGFVFRKENENLRGLFNRELASFIGTQEHLATIAPFGFTENQLPGSVTAEQLCQG